MNAAMSAAMSPNMNAGMNTNMNAGMNTNPLSIRDNTIIVLDSLDRDIAKYPEPNNYVIKLPENIRNAETIELMSLQLTRSETNVNSGNNKLKITINSTQYLLEITEGEISSGTDLALAIQTAINLNPTLKTAYGFTATFTTRLVIANNSSTTPFTIFVEENSAKLFGLLGNGTRGKGTITSVVNNGYHKIIGNRNIDITGTPYLILNINDYTRVVSASNEAHKSFYIIPMEKYIVGQRFVMSGDEKEKKGLYILSNSQQNMFEMRVSFKRPDGSLYDFKGIDHVFTFRVYRNDYKDY